jgi:deoxyribodipyrimidine photo-lyase
MGRTNVKQPMENFPSSRATAWQRLQEFVLVGAADYARTRNFVRAGHSSVSRLSAALRHRLIAEEEVVTAVLSVHRFPAVEKFVQEVVWRTYWKGWLEQHPGVWADYVRLEAEPLPEVPADGAMSVFTEELRSTGYLHNHARMWWAAWWCHQHGLPWAAGARFFFDHLLDADAASNTLGWRWVAGLQTPGKAYLARRDNLAKYWEDHVPLDGIEDDARARIPNETADRSRVVLPEYPEEPPRIDGQFALLGHADDLSIETTPLGGLRPAAVALVNQPGATDGEAKRVWRERAMDDAADRWAAHYGMAVERLSRWDGLPAWVAGGGYEAVVLMAPFVGPDGEAWRSVRGGLAERGVRVLEFRRGWDGRLFPGARAGFFPFWHQTRSWLVKRFA